eukprot:scaffold5504_cov53-Cyclotella_meneghiniana.AAC.10
MILSNQISLLSAILTLTPTPEVHAHGYLKSPRSRNYFAHTDGVWWGGTASDPRPENCPHCLNIGGTEGRCGVIESRNYDYPKNSLGGDLAPVIQACYQPGAVVEFEASLTAYHMGHMQFYACPISAGQVPTQACFDSNPLTFISDELYGATPDPLYPERAYIPNNDYDGFVKDGELYKFLFKYQLPANLSVTGNSCKDVGYDTYNWPNGFYPGNIPVCDQPLPHDGRGVPEQFWNCVSGVIVEKQNHIVPKPHVARAIVGMILPRLQPPRLPRLQLQWKRHLSFPRAVLQRRNNAGPEIHVQMDSVVPSGATVEQQNHIVPKPHVARAIVGMILPRLQPPRLPRLPLQWKRHLSFPRAVLQRRNNVAPEIHVQILSAAVSGVIAEKQNHIVPKPHVARTIVGMILPRLHPPQLLQLADQPRLLIQLIMTVVSLHILATGKTVPPMSKLMLIPILVMIAFAVSYMWTPSKSDCDGQCNIASTVPICNNANNQQLVNKWRNLGKKVIVSFGGAAMGGSWSGDNNHCWDYCFGREEQLSTALVTIVENQNFDGVDIDYEYCYDVNGLQSGRCTQRTSLYSDTKAQTFLDTLTSKLRTKLDALQVSNGYNRGRYELCLDIPVLTSIVNVI